MKNFFNKLKLWLNQNKWFFSFVLLLGISAVSLEAAQAGTAPQVNFEQSLGGAGDAAREATITAIKGWIWLLGFLPLGVAGFVTLKVKNYLEQKDEQNPRSVLIKKVEQKDEQGGGQTELKWSCYMKLIATFVAVVIITYIVLGVFAKVFAGKDFADSWQFFVVNFWSQLLN